MSKHSNRAKKINLLAACASGNIQEVLTICNNKKRQNEIHLRDNHYWTPLHHCIAQSSVECLEILLKVPQLNLVAKTFEGLTALHLACTRPSTPYKIVEMLLEQNSGLVNLYNNEEVSPLQNAIQINRLDIVKLLIRYGAIVSYKDLDGEDALFYAVRQMNFEILQYLLNDANSNQLVENVNRKDCLRIAIRIKELFPREQSLKCITLLLQLRSKLNFIVSTTHHIELITQCILDSEIDLLHLIFELFYLVDTNDDRFFVEKLLTLNNRRCNNTQWYGMISRFHSLITTESSYLSKILVRYPDPFGIFNVWFSIFEQDSDFFQKLIKKMGCCNYVQNAFVENFPNFLLNFVCRGHNIRIAYEFLKVWAICGLEINTILMYNYSINDFGDEPCAEESVITIKSNDASEDELQKRIQVLTVLVPFSTIPDIYENYIPDEVPTLLDLSRITIRRILFCDTPQYLQLSRVDNLPIPKSIKQKIRFFNPILGTEF